MQTRKPILILAVLVVLAVAPVLSFAQGTPAPSFTPEQLDKLVARIALYPDSLLAQVLAAATYPDQIPDAARWADQHHYLTGQALANAIQADHLPWDPSVQALLPFPSVLELMAMVAPPAAAFAGVFIHFDTGCLRYHGVRASSVAALIPLGCARSPCLRESAHPACHSNG